MARKLKTFEVLGLRFRTVQVGAASAFEEMNRKGLPDPMDVCRLLEIETGEDEWTRLDTRAKVIKCSEVKAIAAQHGFTRIPNKILSIAMIAAGGKHHGFGNGASNYIFEGAFQKVDVIRSTTEKVAQYLKQEAV